MQRCQSLLINSNLDELSLKNEASRQYIPYLSLKKVKSADVEVLIVVDPFTAAYDVKGLLAFAQVIRKLGFKPGFLRPYVNGKLSVIRGDRRSFVRFASKQAARLNLLAMQGVTLVGYDPALTICYRDEYNALLKDRRGDFNVLLPEEWLSSVLQDEKVKQRIKENLISNSSGLKDPYYLFCHCTENATVPKAVSLWQEVMRAFNLDLLPVPVACCGMAGLFGHMAQNQDETYQVYRQNWQGEIRSRPFERCLVTGFSCRSQVKRMEQKQALHPVQVIASVLKG